MPKGKEISLRNTNQRQIILEYLQRSKAHPTAEQIYKSVRKSLPRISFGTVYRNLKILENQGQIAPLTYCKEYTRYEACVDNHYHFVCQHCDKVIEIQMDEMLELNSQVAKRCNLQVNTHKLFFFGCCQTCSKLNQ
jgi:Fe2+ or Zn2+ uptake regulation protein